MSAEGSQSETDFRAHAVSSAGDLRPQMPVYVRAAGSIRADFAGRGARSNVARLNETGGLRLRFPRTPSVCEGVIVNTAGGIVEGDRAVLAFSLASDAAVTLTTTAAEKVYRGETQRPAELDVTLKLADRAALDWLPQELILFNGARLQRRLGVDMANDARLLLTETVVFGRLAMGEICTQGALSESWRIRRGGRLVLADEFRISDHIASRLDRPACAAGARAMSTIVCVAPDAEARIDAVRDAIAATGCDGAASAWNGLLLARVLSPSPEDLRATTIAIIACLRDAPLPRLWH